MKAALLSFLIVASFFIHRSTCYYNTRNNTEPLDLSGGSYSSILRVPYQAQICKGYLLHCGAAIISKNWLLTAAHCFQDRPISELKVITGTRHSCDSTAKAHKIATVIVHSEYDSKTLNNDICLIKLYQPIEFSNVQQSVKVATKGPIAGVMMLFSGYGSEGVNQGQAPSLKVARIPVLHPNKCKALYDKTGDTIADTAFCAGGGVNTACFGDSGGPGVVGGRLAGIVSAGRDCGSPKFPSIFTRVSLFRRWIEQHADVRL